MAGPDPKLRELFSKAAEYQAAKEQAAFLDQACQGDAELRAQLEELLQAHREAGSFLQETSAPRAETIDLPAPAERPGTVIGPYKLLQQIGEGGMGTVFMAEQTKPVQRKVALKVIKAGLDSRQITARFEAERQALAMMDHVNIARVFDGGATASGRPYFVMELVHGEPITKYCDDNHLTPRERLELFVPVCQALQHAHQKGIIHRDIKPSNVMVTLYDGKPVPKVIDFGVAKATEQKLTQRTLFTQYGTMVGTLEYMSPEQAEMSALGVDTRSDIFSLGVLLYELLTGSTPLSHKRMKEAAYAEILRMIKEEEPQKPSTRLSDSGEALASISANRHTEPAKLTKLVRGELDWIVMKTLEKDRNRRYETANAFAADVQRYLADETVQACPPSAGYRFRKFARRNKRALVTAALLALAVFVVAGTVGWAIRDRGSRAQEAARDRAAREATTAAQVGQVLDESEDLYRHRKLPEATQLARNAVALVEGGTASPEVERRAREWHNDLDMVPKLDSYTIDDKRRSLAEYLQAFREYDIDLEALPPEEAAARIAARPIRVDLAAALDRCVANLLTNGEPGVAALRARLGQIARRADPDLLRNRLRDAWLNEESAGKSGDARLRELAASVDLAATPIATLILIGDAQDVRDSIAFYTRVQQQHPDDFEIANELGRRLRIFAGFPQEGGTPEDVDRAITFLTAAVAIRPTNWFVRSELGLALQKKGLVDEAVAAFREFGRLRPEQLPESRRRIANALATKKDRKEEALAIYLELVRAAPDAWAVRMDFGRALRGLDRADEAIGEFREAIRILPNNADGHNWLGLALEDKGSRDEAIAAYREAIRLSANYWLYRFNLGVALSKKSSWDEAIAAYREAVRLNPKAADAHSELGRALRQANQSDEAIVAYQEAVRLAPKNKNALLGLGHVFFDKGQWDEAITAYRAAARLDPGDAERHADLGNTFLRKGSLDEAIGAFREAIRLGPNDSRGHILLAHALMRQRRTDEAIASYREGIRLQKDDANGYQGLGNALALKELLNEAIDAYRDAIRLDPKNSRAYYGTGDAYARLGRWKEAADAFDHGLKLAPAGHDPWYVAAALHAAAGDLEGYRRTCREMLKRFGDTDQPRIAHRTAAVCLLQPDTLNAADSDLVQKLAGRVVTGTEGNGNYRYFMLAKALADDRAGRHAEAVKWLERFAPNADGTHEDAVAFAVLAMAQHRLSRSDDAGAALAKARAIVAKMPDPARGQRFGGDWYVWLHAQVLCREAEAILKKESGAEK